jgi:hypothetical protein
MQVSLDEGHDVHPTPASSGAEDASSGRLTTVTEDPSRSRGSLSTPPPADGVASSENPGVSHAASSAPGSVTGGDADGAVAPQPDHSSYGGSTAEESPPIYNPLTHYMTRTDLLHHPFVACHSCACWTAGLEAWKFVHRRIVVFDVQCTHFGVVVLAENSPKVTVLVRRNFSALQGKYPWRGVFL